MKALLALAAAVLTGPGTPYFDGPPPPRFVKEAVAVILFTDQAGIERWCGAPPEGMVRLGCQITATTGEKLIVVPHPGLVNPEFDYAGLLNHEIAHHEGWGRMHEL